MKSRTVYQVLYMTMLVVLLCSCLIPVISAKSISPQDYIFKLGSKDQPLDFKELKEERTKIVDRFISTHSKSSSPGGFLTLGDPIIPPDAYIVAYGFIIDDAGIPYQLVGLASGETARKPNTTYANQWYEDHVINPKSPAAEKDSGGWILIGLDDGYWEVPEYGFVSHNWESYWNSDETIPDKEYFAIKQLWTMDPGFRRWRVNGSKWVSDQGWSEIDWSYSTFSGTSLHDRDPLGTTVGPQTVGISLNPAPSLSWSFLLNGITIYDNSDPAQKIAKWYYVFNAADTKTTIQGWEPGSSVVIDAVTGQGQGDFAYLFAKGRFIDPTTWPNTQWYEVWYYWNLILEYY